MTRTSRCVCQALNHRHLNVHSKDRQTDAAGEEHGRLTKRREGGGGGGGGTWQLGQ